MAIVDIPLGESDYLRLSAGNPRITLRNVYSETDPTTPSQKTFVRRPGIKGLFSVGTGPIRSVYHRVDVFDNAIFVISGNHLYSASRTGDSSFSSRLITGTIASGDISMTASGDKLFITDKSKLQYTDGAAPLVEISTPDDASIGKVAYISGYIICIRDNSQRFYWIQPGETTIDPLDFAEAEGLPDGIVDIVVLGDQIYFFGKETIEVWYLSGDAASPFQRIQGKLVGVGAIENSATPVAGNDTFFFLAKDGTARVGPQLSKVSTPAVEERFRRAIAAFNVARN